MNANIMNITVKELIIIFVIAVFQYQLVRIDGRLEAISDITTSVVTNMAVNEQVDNTQDKEIDGIKVDVKENATKIEGHIIEDRVTSHNKDV